MDKVIFSLPVEIYSGCLLAREAVIEDWSNHNSQKNFLLDAYHKPWF